MRSYLFMGACYAIAGGSGIAAHYFGGWPGLIVWLVVCLWIGFRFTPNGWDDVYSRDVEYEPAAGNGDSDFEDAFGILKASTAPSRSISSINSPRPGTDLKPPEL